MGMVIEVQEIGAPYCCHFIYVGILVFEFKG
ncbi:MAG: hypothetical protein SCARUB_04550 [Candidatus Scalindua rubra]|uniref:Uncharacterized protein n=1 Tax=Candidatus Scalindua rubra TaxID=1872076 RepID=A0A1E3X469_9BACT|nr:MAG: hypothetical protein SCARUB_04550 [Candidatus Scalindua rubra]